MDRTPDDSVDTERFEKALDERVVAMVTEEDEEQHFRLQAVMSGLALPPYRPTAHIPEAFLPHCVSL